MKGRQKCKKACCASDLFLKKFYVEKEWSQKRIAEVCGSSAQHISIRLRGLGVKCRKRKNYPASRGGTKPRTHPFWRLSEETLRGNSIKLLIEKYRIPNTPQNISYAYKVKRRVLSEKPT